MTWALIISSVIFGMVSLVSASLHGMAVEKKHQAMMGFFFGFAFTFMIAALAMSFYAGAIQ